MSLPQEVIAVIEEEERILQTVLASLRAQRYEATIRLQTESAKAQELTARIVSAKRDEEKQMLASDEAVAHGLSLMKRTELKSLDELLSRPYFARVTVQEQLPNKVTEIEYKIGTHSNLDCRIIDWRKAPISKLFYEYREGDEYFEEIQGRERTGRILLRNKVEIRRGVLQRVSCRLGDFVKELGEWKILQGGFRGRVEGGSRAQLPDILSLITEDQFRTITEGADSAVLIQGVAGSGKTTVALHRLSWLLHDNASSVSQEDALILVRSPALKRYIEESLPALQIERVPVQTYVDFLERRLRRSIGEAHVKRGDSEGVLRGEFRIMRSTALLTALENAAQRMKGTEIKPWNVFLPELLNRTQDILNLDDTALLDREILREFQRNVEDQIAKREFEKLTASLIIRYLQIVEILSQGQDSKAKRLEQLVVDEVQDFSVVELAVLAGEAKELGRLTLAGDTSQEVSAESSFPGWEKLRAHWGLDDTTSHFVSLSVSHRSTFPIMRFADSISGTNRTTSGRQGKAPLWFLCRSEDTGVREAIGWLQRVMERFPNDTAVVLTKTLSEARQVVSLLEPSFGQAVRLGEEESFSFDEGIVVTAIPVVKGLEFAHVLLWNLSATEYPLGERNRRLLYVAATRAEEHLAIVSWGRPSPLLPSPESKLVRLVEEVVEEAQSERD